MSLRSTCQGISTAAESDNIPMSYTDQSSTPATVPVTDQHSSPSALTNHGTASDATSDEMKEKERFKKFLRREHKTASRKRMLSWDESDPRGVNVEEAFKSLYDESQRHQTSEDATRWQFLCRECDVKLGTQDIAVEHAGEFHGGDMGLIARRQSLRDR
ncbi:MAG: hypothetical protein Q9218_004744 [Villophora microphyllina]